MSKCILLRQRANCLKVMKCQHRNTIVWVDCAKMTCCIGFFFSFLWVYTCCCISKEGFGEESWNVGAKTQSTLFENHKGLGLKLIFVSIKFFKILICEILNRLLLSVIMMKNLIVVLWCIRNIGLYLDVFFPHQVDEISIFSPQNCSLEALQRSCSCAPFPEMILNETLLCLIELSLSFSISAQWTFQYSNICLQLLMPVVRRMSCRWQQFHTVYKASTHCLAHLVFVQESSKLKRNIVIPLISPACIVSPQR